MAEVGRNKCALEKWVQFCWIKWMMPFNGKCHMLVQLPFAPKGWRNWPPVQATRFLFRSFCDILMPQNWTFKNRDFLNSDDEEEEEDVSGQRRIRSSWTDQLNPQQQQQQQSVNSGSTKESNRFDYPPPATPQNNNSQQQQQPVNPSSGGRKLNSGMYHFWWTVNDCDCRSRVKLANLGQSFGFIWINKET